MALKKAVIALAKQVIPPQLLRQRLNPSGRGAVLLTFDDGPCPEVTPRVLDMLDHWSAKAVFFVTGERVASAPRLADEILKRGHRLGNHTFSHLVKAGFRQYRDDIERCQQQIFDATGKRPSLFRPPQGHLTVPKFWAVKRSQLAIIRWSFDTGEYSYLRRATPQQRAANLLAHIRDRAIVLSHDDTPQTADMLAVALPQLVERGFDLSKGVDCLN